MDGPENEVRIMARTFRAVDVSTLPPPPLSLGLMGPPGGGKTKSALRVADGFARVRGGKPALIDTEAGRALKYLRSDRNPNGHDFHYIPFAPPFVPEDFLAAIKAAEELNPAAIIVDSMSDEHEGEGGVLDWHDRAVPQMGGNEWAAWSKPKASRRILISGIQQIRTPLIVTFRAREKTRTEKNSRGKEVPVNIGFMPIAPAEIVHTLDLTCLLPHRANGVPEWESPKSGEDFVIKLPEFLAPMIRRGAPLDEELGEALARWQAGTPPASSTGNGKRKRSPQEQVDAYVERINAIGSLDELQTFQTSEGVTKFVDSLREGNPALLDRVIAANSRRTAELGGYPDDDPDDADDEFPAPPEED